MPQELEDGSKRSEEIEISIGLLKTHSCRVQQNRFGERASPTKVFFEQKFMFILLYFDFHDSPPASTSLNARIFKQKDLVKQCSNLSGPTLLFSRSNHKKLENANFSATSPFS